MIKLYIPSALHMQKLGSMISEFSMPGQVILLQGPLGAGKTTLVRGFLRQKGYSGLVKSPTYGLVEEYALLNQKICHFDLYRLQDVSELFELGFADYMTNDAICLIEWPQIAISVLSTPALNCQIELATNEQGRWVSLSSAFSKINDILIDINKQWTVLNAQVD